MSRVAAGPRWDDFITAVRGNKKRNYKAAEVNVKQRRHRRFILHYGVDVIIFLL